MTGKEKILGKAAKAADIALGGGGFASFLLLFYVIYYYGWSGQRQFVNLLGATLYYGFPAAVAVLLFVGLRLSPAYKVNLAISFVALVGSVYGIDLFLHFFSPALLKSTPIWLLEGKTKEEKQEAAAKIARRFGVKFDTRDRINVIADLKKQGIDAVPAIIPRILLMTTQGREVREPSDLPMATNRGMASAINIHGEETLPLGGVANKMTVVCNESGRWVTYTSDEHGFNNPNDIWQSGQMDVAAVGDSFTQGYCSPREKSFMGLVRQRYPATLTLGMAGDGPLYMLATLREYLPSLKPKVVLWCYYEQDALPELQIEKKSALLMRYLSTGFSQGLLGRQSDIDHALVTYIEKETAKELRKRAQPRDRYYDDLLQIIKLSTLRRRLGLTFSATPENDVLRSEVQGPGMDLFREILSRAKADVSGWGGRLYFVYLPSWRRYAGSPEIGAEQRAQVLAAVTALGIPIVDIHPAFEAQGDPRSFFPFRGPGHYNEKGERITGAEIVKTISSDWPYKNALDG